MRRAPNASNCSFESQISLTRKSLPVLNATWYSSPSGGHVVRCCLYERLRVVVLLGGRAWGSRVADKDAHGFLLVGRPDLIAETLRQRGTLLLVSTLLRVPASTAGVTAGSASTGLALPR